MLQEELRTKSLAKPTVSGEWRDTGRERLGKLLLEQKGAGVHSKSESNSGCTQPWVTWALGTSVGWIQWSQVE